MSDTNLTRAKKKEQEKANKAAFKEIFGDPFNDLLGYYDSLKAGSEIDEFTLINFVCDVENVLRDALTQEEIFYFYIYCNGECKPSRKWMKEIEQKIGTLLLQREISPVKEYFK